MNLILWFSYSRTNSTESTKRLLVHSTPTRSHSFDTSRKPFPLMQVPIEPPPIAPKQRSLLPSSPITSKPAGSSIQDRLSTHVLTQQKVEKPHTPVLKPDLSQRLNIQRSVAVPTVSCAYSIIICFPSFFLILSNCGWCLTDRRSTSKVA